MQRVAYMIRVKADQIEKYKTEHATIPAQLTADLKAADVRNSSLWMGPDGLVFGYLECENWPAVRDQMSRSEANPDWQTRMHSFQDTPPGMVDDMWIRMLDLVCATD